MENYTLLNNKFFAVKNIAKLDGFFLTMILVLLLFGFIMLYSAGGGSLYPWAYSQIKRLILFIPIFLFIVSLNLVYIHKYAYLFYFVALAMLVAAEFAGHTAMGATRWLKLGFFSIQPSEFMKLCMIIALSRYFHNTHLSKIRSLFFLTVPLFMVIIPVGLVLKQPDLGTAFILFVCAMSLFFLGGVRAWLFIVSGIVGIASIPVGWNFLKDYQKQRVLTFLNPDSDPLGSGYNIIQSKIAAGSGGLFGKGYLSGSQGQLSFLPEQETDFIFTMIAEEFGFIGSIFLIISFSIIFFRIYVIAKSTRNHFGKLLCSGLATFLFLHCFINIAMVIGIIPVVGAPLPLISYGGPMLIITLTTFALILNVDINKEEAISRV